MSDSTPQWLHDDYQRTEYADERIRRKNERYGYTTPDRRCIVQQKTPLGGQWEHVRHCWGIRKAIEWARFYAVESIEARVLDFETRDVLWTSDGPDDPEEGRVAA